jgi:hypothetical protein
MNRQFVFFFLSLLLISLASCWNTKEFDGNKTITCGAEKKDKKGEQFVADNDPSIFFSGGKLQTDEDAHTGKYSVKTTKKSAFAFGVSLSPGADKYFKISVWRKSKDENKGVLVASSEKNKELYLATSRPVVTEKNGWQKLEMDFFTPPTFDGKKLKIYIWNNSKDTIYFDDLKIEIYSQRTYPVYKEEPLALILDTSKFIKIKKIRERAFYNHILQSTDDDWVKAMIFGDGKMMKAKIRLKGDWLDHLQGDKWSFRVKLKKGFAWRRLRTFSVQTPLARGYLMKWVAHKFYDSQDILTTRYGFVPLFLNNRSLGLYAYEEHFVKQLVESRNRREGPIVKFTEDAFWQMQKIYKIQQYWQPLPFFESTVIKPFKQSKTIESPSLRKQFNNAAKLMQQYKTGSKLPSEIFNVDALAKYYASLELTHARHGMAWHNQRFYYNPLIDRLEPISFDGYTEDPKIDFSINDNYLYKAFHTQGRVKAEEALVLRLFGDSVFREKYLHFLKKYSTEQFVDSVLQTFHQDLVYNDSLLRIEFPDHPYDHRFYQKSARAIRQYLPKLEKYVDERLKQGGLNFTVRKEKYTDSTVFENTPEFFVNTYIQEKKGDSVLLYVENYFPRSIILTGTGKKKKFADYHFVEMPKLKPFKEKVDTLKIWADTNATYLFFMIKGEYDDFVSEINPWPVPRGLTPRQELMEKVDLSLPVFAKVEKEKIFIKQGTTTVDYPVIIPEGYTVYFEPGTTLDFVDSAFLISFSPVVIKGRKEQPVEIRSSDWTSQGFQVLHPKGKCVVHHARFVNLNTLNYKTWTLTGAVTFYEADVDFNHFTIKNNQCEDALNTVRSKFTMDHAHFEKTFGDAFDSDFSTGKIDHTTFVNIGNDAIDFSGSKIDIERVLVDNASDKGVSGGEDSHLRIKEVEIKNCNIGIASKDLSHLDVLDSRIEDCKYGLVLLRKKPEYGPATMTLKNTIITGCPENWLIEKGSSIIIDGKKIEGIKKNVDKMFY